MEKICAECGAPFLSRRIPTQQLYCGKACQKNSRTKRRRKKKGRVISCMHCGTTFVGSSNGQKIFCSRSCYQQARQPRIYEYNNARRRNMKRTHPWRMPVEAAKNRAAIKSIEYNLTEVWAKNIWTGRCAISKLPFKYERSSHGPSIFAPSIDRIDSTKGYTQGNCRFVLACINFFKNNGTDAEMFEIAKAIVTSQRNVSPDFILSLPC